MKSAVRRVFAVTALVSAGLSGTPVAIAAREGAIDQLNCGTWVIRTITVTDKVLYGSWDGVATVTNQTGDVLGAKQSVQCFGVWSFADGKYREHGYCDVLNEAGDRALTEIEGIDQAGKWRYLSGFGKLAGLTGGGTYVPGIQYPAVRPGTLNNCTPVKGTYRLP